MVLWFLLQNAAGVPAFEAASVKPAGPGRGLGPLRGGPGTNSPGQLSGTATLRTLLIRAYDLKAYQIAGPAWLETERYDLVAKIPAGSSREQVALMLQALLAERFHVATHREKKELPIYALVVGKGGSRLKESPTEGPSGGANPRLVRGADGFPEIAAGSSVDRSYEVVVGGSDGIVYKLWARRETMQQFADRLSSHLNRAVLDRTGMTGSYDFSLSWTIEAGGVPRTDPPPDEIDMHPGPVGAPGESIFSAVQAQLGLKLETGKGPLEILTVDRADKVPVGN
ncbi:MAG TPA: TIGR03435 family protein [Candidatus Sulfopaludibacter sp.]|nr:TIGR03435 family protein [Candidatus Sulfopaludibacter sp.]